MNKNEFHCKQLALLSQIRDQAKYVKAFLSGDWVLDSPAYEIAVPQSEHGVTSPSIVQAWEDIGGGLYELVAVGVIIDASNGVTISVTETPDGRFAGFLAII
jgi:hypothetical protein